MSDQLGAILHNPLKTLDASQLRSLPTREAADACTGLLRSLEGIEDAVFAARGMACLIIEERELYKELTDPEVDRPFGSLDRFLKWACPKSWSYCRDALRTVKELKETPLTDLLEIKRCNLEILKKTSTHVRKEPRVIEAAKTQSEAQFTQILTTEFNQHIEQRKTFKATYDAGEYAEVEKFLQWVGQHLPEPTEDLGAALLAFAIDHNIEVAEESA